MKIRKLVVATMALALFGNFSVAYAEGPHKARGDHGGKRHNVSRMFNAMDADGSETVTLDEWLVKPADKAERHFNRIDSDDDNLISLDEFLARGHGRERDIEIDRDAVRACVVDATGEDLPERPDPETVFAGIDTDNDGFISLDEFTAAKTEKATTRFNQVDANDDGAITLEELTEAFQQRRVNRRTVRDCVEQQHEEEALIG